MKQFPSIPRTEEVPSDLLDSGHLWIQELVDGAHFRFRLRESGMLQFGDRNRVYRDPDDIPLPYHHAVRHVREEFDREALRAARDDVSSVVFFGVATHRHTIDYDWERTPSFLGFDVWDDADEGQFLPPDAVEQIYDRLGLQSVNVFEKEVRATDFDPKDYEIPSSAWYDGPAAGVVLRNKTGQRAKILHPDFEAAGDVSVTENDATAEDLAREYATRDRVEAVADELEDRGRSVTFDAVYDRVVEAIVREETLLREEGVIDAGAFRSEVAARTQEFLDE